MSVTQTPTGAASYEAESWAELERRVAAIVKLTKLYTTERPDPENDNTTKAVRQFKCGAHRKRRWYASGSTIPLRGNGTGNQLKKSGARSTQNQRWYTSIQQHTNTHIHPTICRDKQEQPLPYLSFTLDDIGAFVDQPKSPDRQGRAGGLQPPSTYRDRSAVVVNPVAARPESYRRRSHTVAESLSPPGSSRRLPQARESYNDSSGRSVDQRNPVYRRRRESQNSSSSSESGRNEVHRRPLHRLRSPGPGFRGGTDDPRRRPVRIRRRTSTNWLYGDGVAYLYRSLS